MDLQKLLDKRAKLLKDMRALLDSAGDTGLTAEKEQQYNRIEEDYEALDKQIKAMQKVNAEEEALKNAINNPIVGGASASTKEKSAIAALMSYIKGETPDKWRNALVTSTGADGGYIVPVEYQRTVIEKLNELGKTRSVSNVITTSSERNIPVEGDAPAFAWVDEGGAYAETSTTFGNVTLGAWKLGGIIKVSEEILQDTMIDLESYLASKIALGIDKGEAPAFATGDGVKKPTGYATGLTAAVTLASSTGITGDEIIDIFYSLKPAYRSRAVWRIEDSWMKAIRKLKDNNGNYIYAPALVNGDRDTILGRPVVPDQNLPAVGSLSSNVIVFGDFGYYTIADRAGLEIQRLNEKYADTGFIGFKVSKRVDAKRALDEAFTAAVTPAT